MNEIIIIDSTSSLSSLSDYDNRDDSNEIKRENNLILQTPFKIDSILISSDHPTPLISPSPPLPSIPPRHETFKKPDLFTDIIKQLEKTRQDKKKKEKGQERIKRKEMEKEKERQKKKHPDDLRLQIKMSPNVYSREGCFQEAEIDSTLSNNTIQWIVEDELMQIAHIIDAELLYNHYRDHRNYNQFFDQVCKLLNPSLENDAFSLHHFPLSQSFSPFEELKIENIENEIENDKKMEIPIFILVTGCKSAEQIHTFQLNNEFKKCLESGQRLQDKLKLMPTGPLPNWSELSKQFWLTALYHSPSIRVSYFRDKFEDSSKVGSLEKSLTSIPSSFPLISLTKWIIEAGKGLKKKFISRNNPPLITSFCTEGIKRQGGKRNPINRDDGSMEAQDTWISILTQINRISRPIAEAISTVIPSMSQMWNAYEEIQWDESKAISLLENITLSNNNKTRIGPVISRRIYRIFSSMNGNELLLLQ